jgi:phosphatidylinositol alpha 1,6-mannosyltransferase
MLERARRSLLAPAVAGWKLIPGGVDLDTFAPGSRDGARRELSLDPGVDLLLYVANLGSENPLKDFPTVRGALARLARAPLSRPVELVVVGADGPDEAAAPGVRIRRAGYVRSPERLARFYRAADVHVHAAVEEPFGLSVAEALACGLPVVTGSRGGVREVVEHERTGLVVPPREPASLAAAIGRLLAAPALRARMGADAAAAARARLDRGKMLETLHAWCAEVHASWSPRP